MPMEKFLERNPKYKRQAQTLQAIKRKVLFKIIPDLNSYLSVFKVPLCKALIKKDFYSSGKLKKTYEEIVKKETNPVEKMIFQMINKREICFSDFKIHFLFYKEFPEFIHLFSSDGSYEMEDLLFRKTYLHLNVDDQIQRKIEKSPVLDQIFYIVCLHSLLDCNFVKNRLLGLKNESLTIRKNENISETEFIHNWIIGIRCLSSSEFYNISASELLYSSYTDKINFFRGLEEFTNLEKLSVFMLNTCFSNPLSIVKTYIVFLKVIELFHLKYEFKLKLLYSWLRFFIIENHLDLFFDLMRHLRKSRKLDDEFELYLQIEEYLNGKLEIQDLENICQNYDDLNRISTIQISQIIEKLKTLPVNI
jgi:hypothetical protein